MKRDKLMEENTYQLGHGTHGTGQNMVATLMQFENYQIENALLSAMFQDPTPHAIIDFPGRETKVPTSAEGGSWCGTLKPFPLQPWQTPIYIVRVLPLQRALALLLVEQGHLLGLQSCDGLRPVILGVEVDLPDLEE